MQPAFRAFASRPQTRQIGLGIEPDLNAAAGIMLSRDDGDRSLGHVDPQPEQLFVDGGEMLHHELGRLVADVEMDVIEAVTFDLIVVGPRHDIARGKLHPLRVIFLHVPLARDRVQQTPAFTAHGFGNQEILDVEIVEARRVELHHLHVGNARACPPGHGDTIASRAPWSRTEQIDAPCAACRQHRCAGDM